jgi:hypothetical protein
MQSLKEFIQTIGEIRFLLKARKNTFCITQYAFRNSFVSQSRILFSGIGTFDPATEMSESERVSTSILRILHVSMLEIELHLRVGRKT